VISLVGEGEFESPTFGFGEQSKLITLDLIYYNIIILQHTPCSLCWKVNTELNS